MELRKRRRRKWRGVLQGRRGRGREGRLRSRVVGYGAWEFGISFYGFVTGRHGRK